MKIVGDDAKLGLYIIEAENSQSDDERWLEVNIEISLIGFRAHFEASVMIDELYSFIDSLSTALDTQQGTVKLSTMEEAIDLRGTIQPRGNVDWSGVLVYPIGIGNRLNFGFETDFYQLQRIKDDLTRELSIFSSHY